MSGHPPMPRGRPFRDNALLLRGRSGLTQHELAALLGVSERSIQKWEAGQSQPSAAHLRHMIALYLERGVLSAGREREEAQALWAAWQGERIPPPMPFDQAWFATLEPPAAVQAHQPASSPVVPTSLAAASGVPIVPSDRVTAPSARTAGTVGPRQDWDAAPDVADFLGRERELATLSEWPLTGQCRVVAVLGLGGIGKSALATRLARGLATRFDAMCWRSLRNAPPVEQWLTDAVRALAPTPPLLPATLDGQVALLLQLLREQRGLLVLDNYETILQAGEPAFRYRAGLAGYGEVLRHIGESSHQSCLVLTSREEPPEVALLKSAGGAVRALHLDGLGTAEAHALLDAQGLRHDGASLPALVAYYGGNPLALKVVGRTIVELFGGQSADFLAYATATSGTVFGGIRRLLDDQFARLSPLERTLLYWLAVEREPVGASVLAAELEAESGRGAVLEALEALRRRSLLERGAQGSTFTLQPVVLEYVTDRLVAEVGRELSERRPRLLHSHALVQATARDYVRQCQERLIAQPLLERLLAACGTAQEAEKRLVELLEAWRTGPEPAMVRGYGPGNVVNLLRLLRGDLRGLDLSHLAIRQAYLQEVEAQDARLMGAHLSQTVLAGAFSYPVAIALSADGASLLAGTSTGELCQWRVADRTLLLALQGHSGLIYGVALNERGTLGATASVDGTVKLWHLEHGRLLATLQGQGGPIYGVALSGNGELVASGSQDGTVKLWESPGGRLLTTLHGHTDGVYGLALSRDGRLLASGSFDGTVRLWETAGGRPLATLQGHSGGVLSLALSEDSALLASGSLDGTIRLWETAGGRPLATLHGHSGGVWSVALDRSGALAASGSLDGTVRLWETAGGRPLATLHGHSGGIQSVALDGDGRLVASGSQDGSIKLWESASGRLHAALYGHNSAIQCVALSRDGRLVAGGGLDGTIRLWEVSDGRPRAALHGHSGGVWGVALSADGALLASGSFDGTVRLWETAGGRLLATLHGHGGLVYSVALSGDGRLVASSSEDETVRLWETAGGRPLATLHGHIIGVRAVALSADGQIAASGSEDGSLKLWAATSGRLLATLLEHTSGLRGLALSDDGALLVSGSEDGAVRLWETTGGRLLATLQEHASGARAVALSGDGRLVASGSYDGTIKLWEAASGRLIVSLHGHAGGVRGVALSGDGALLASGGVDGMVRLWEARSGACLRTLQGDRRYERLDITGLSGVTEAQHVALRALGAVEHTAGAAKPMG